MPSPYLFSAFSLQAGGAKKKLTKRNAVLRGAAPAPCELLKKLDQNFYSCVAVMFCRDLIYPVLLKILGNGFGKQLFCLIKLLFGKCRARHIKMTAAAYLFKYELNVYLSVRTR